MTYMGFIILSGAGEKFKNNVFVGDYNNCNPYCFGDTSTNNWNKTGHLPREWGLSGLGVVDDNDNQTSAVTSVRVLAELAHKIGPTDDFPYVLSIYDDRIYNVYALSIR